MFQLLPPSPTWWLLALVGLTVLITAIPLIHAWMPRATFPEMSYGGVRVSESVQARIWRALLVSAVGLAALGVGGTAITRSNDWVRPASAGFVPGALFTSVGLYSWSVSETLGPSGEVQVRQTEDLVLPWPLLVAVALYWWQMSVGKPDGEA